MGGTVRRTVSFLLARQKWVAFTICGYEVCAIATGRTPTVTALCERYRWLGPAVLASLALHLYLPPRPQVIIVPSAGDCLLRPDPF